jgi:hypothetical protein
MVPSCQGYWAVTQTYGIPHIQQFRGLIERRLLGLVPGDHALLCFAPARDSGTVLLHAARQCLVVERALPDYDQYIPKTKKAKVEKTASQWLEKVKNDARQSKKRAAGGRLRAAAAQDRKRFPSSYTTTSPNPRVSTSTSAGESP